MFIVKALFGALATAASAVLGTKVTNKTTEDKGVIAILQNESEKAPLAELIQEIIPPVNKEAKTAKKGVVYISRPTLKNEFAGMLRPGKTLKGAWKLKSSFFNVADEMKVKDRGLWSDFAREFPRSTDEDTVEEACKNYASRMTSFYRNRSWLKDKIKDYCFVQYGFSLKN